MENLKSVVIETIRKYPHLKDEVMGLYELCLSEIEEGGSTSHEIELCLSDIQDLIDGEG